MTDALPPQYNPASIEADLYRFWLDRGLFSPAPPPSRRAAGSPSRPYVIMMPPPNVTAVLHMGHGLNNTVQDVLARFERMRGRPTLWLPGTDHAGIATQNVVERLLAGEGKTRFEIGREEFERRVWTFVKETGGTILDQLKAIGASADWSRTYFTLDQDLSHAVREVFVRLHEKGLIYRGKYIINWCPRCLTALSNEEAEKTDQDGQLWHLKYPVADGSGFVIVATTRPETMLGDTAVAVHPKDPRHTDLIGKEVFLPLVERRIPILGDDAVDPAFGTGAVKVTPAHDALDFEIGQRHDLPAPEVIGPDGRMTPGLPPLPRRPGSLRGPPPGGARVRAARPAGEDRGPSPRGGPLLPLRHGDRAPAVGPVVRPDEAAGRTRAGRIPGRAAALHPRAPG